MNKRSLVLMIPAALLLSGGIASSALANECGQAFSTQSPIRPEASWRESRTQRNQSGEVSATSPRRESTIQSKVAWLEDFILNFQGEWGKGDIPPMDFVAAEGTDIQTLSRANGLGGVISRYKVSNLGPDGIVRGTLLLPVSGHQGNANAKAWAKSDLYTIRTDTNPNNIPSTHSTWGGTRMEKDLLSNVKSLDLVTAQEVEIPLKANVPVVVLYYRKGSAGPSGYVEGRVMEFIWDGT